MTALAEKQFASSLMSSGAYRDAPVSSWHGEFSDGDEQAACVASIYPQTYDQLSAGRFAGSMTTIDLGGVLLVREHVNRRLIQNGVIGAVSMLWAWQKRARYRSNGFEHPDNCVYFFNANETFEILTDPSDMVIISLSEQALIGWFGYHPCQSNPNLFRGPRQLPDNVAASMRHGLTTVLEAVDRARDSSPHDRCHDTLRDELLQRVTAIAELPGIAERDQRRCMRTYDRVVRAARECIMRDSDATLTDLCTHIGVSRRNLHYSFKAVMGISPGHFLRSVRLNAARRDIKRADPTIPTLADIASRWGFWHPSHFAADYKRRFGELPSETALRSASVRQGG